jgi:hypothetical protein
MFFRKRGGVSLLLVARHYSSGGGIGATVAKLVQAPPTERIDQVLLQHGIVPRRHARKFLLGNEVTAVVPRVKQRGEVNQACWFGGIEVHDVAPLFVCVSTERIWSAGTRVDPLTVTCECFLRHLHSFSSPRLQIHVDGVTLMHE